mgnify:CR=1 FL=1
MADFGGTDNVVATQSLTQTAQEKLRQLVARIERLEEEKKSIGDDIKDIRDEVKVPGLTVELGGDIFVAQMSSASEVIGVIGAVVILLVAFGSLLAMGLPIVTALFGIGCGVALVGLASNRRWRPAARE